MNKIKPTSILPYSKEQIPAKQTPRSVNISKSLSTKMPPKSEIKTELFPLFTAASSFKLHIKREAEDATDTPPPRDNKSHLQAIIGAWQRRKDWSTP